MHALVAAIHVFLVFSALKTWMAGSSPAMTSQYILATRSARALKIRTLANRGRRESRARQRNPQPCV
jgi:hypothetical protein